MTEFERQCYDWGWEDAENRSLDALYSKRRQLEQLVILAEAEGATDGKWFFQDRIKDLDGYIALIRGETE